MAYTIDLGVCRDVCIPFQTSINTSLSNKSNVAEMAIIKKALRKVPISPDELDLSLDGCDIEWTDQRIDVTAQLSSRVAALTGELYSAFELTDHTQDLAWIEDFQPTISDPQQDHGSSRITAKASILPFSDEGFILDRSSLRFTLLGIGDGIAVEHNGCPEFQAKH